jgi:putative SOS response-associated peptidase YedK
MCGRYVPPEEAAMERFWKIDRRNNNPLRTARFNVAPTSQVPIVVWPEQGPSTLIEARWGLIPRDWKRKQLPQQTFNARSEEAADKPTWRDSLRSLRCLMPARGWYEWNENEQVRSVSGKPVNQPYFIHSPHEPALAIAGLWSVWEPAGMDPVVSCALLTTAAAPAIAGIHHRMPVVLREEQLEAWLRPETAAADVARIIQDPQSELVGYRVSTRVNNARNDSPDLLEPVAAPVEANYRLF